MMSYLKVTLIDVGWGDSILIEASDPPRRPRFALVDSNDNMEDTSGPAKTFLRKHFGLREVEFDISKPYFDFVMLSHDHADHGSGLKKIMQEFGTQEFLYSKDIEEETDVLPMLLNYVNRWNVNIPNESVDDRYTGNLGGVDLTVLWPQHDVIDRNPNNNSIVLVLTLANVTFLLTGDAEGKVWNNIANNIPGNTKFFKVPHHGSKNGTIHHGGTPWLDQTDNLTNKPFLGISCHPNYPNRYDLPDKTVLEEFHNRIYSYHRTDQHFHVTYKTDGNNISVKYSH